MRSSPSARPRFCCSASSRATYATAEASRITNIDQVWTIASLVVFASIVVHGVSATPLVRGYGRLIALKRIPERAPEPAGEHA